MGNTDNTAANPLKGFIRSFVIWIKGVVYALAGKSIFTVERKIIVGNRDNVIRSC